MIPYNNIKIYGIILCEYLYLDTRTCLSKPWGSSLYEVHNHIVQNYHYYLLKHRNKCVYQSGLLH